MFFFNNILTILDISPLNCSNNTEFLIIVVVQHVHIDICPLRWLLTVNSGQETADCHHVIQSSTQLILTVANLTCTGSSVNSCYYVGKHCTLYEFQFSLLDVMPFDVPSPRIKWTKIYEHGRYSKPEATTSPGIKSAEIEQNVEIPCSYIVRPMFKVHCTKFVKESVHKCA